MAGERPGRLDLLAPLPKEGKEPIRGTSHTLIDFWRWYASDLGSNTLRGSLAEFIVARALGDMRAVRVEWDPFDVLTPDGVRVEVKSSGYLQGWHQRRPSRIEFGRFRGLAWDADAGAWSNAAPDVRADVFVFAVETCQDPTSYDPLDLAQWEFYVVAAEDIRVSGLRSGGLTWVRRLAGSTTPYAQLSAAVASVARS